MCSLLTPLVRVSRAESRAQTPDLSTTNATHSRAGITVGWSSNTLGRRAGARATSRTRRCGSGAGGARRRRRCRGSAPSRKALPATRLVRGSGAANVFGAACGELLRPPQACKLLRRCSSLYRGGRSLGSHQAGVGRAISSERPGGASSTRGHRPASSRRQRRRGGGRCRRCATRRSRARAAPASCSRAA